jgi:SAM-dependent methyltransferase
MATLSPSPFDALAADYDRKWTNAPCGLAQRKAVWRQVGPYFRGLDAVLDLGCGTGADAIWLQSIGVMAYGMDSSAGMVEYAQARGVRAEKRAMEDLDALSGPFDGALSNFGALNCVESIGAVAASLGRLVRTGGYVAVCLLGRACLWEMAHYLAKGKVAKAFRRRRGQASSSIGVTVRYPSHGEVLRAFDRGFQLRDFTGVGVCVPPSYVDVPRAFVRIAERLDRRIAHWPGLRSVGDHRLYVFERI